MRSLNWLLILGALLPISTLGQEVVLKLAGERYTTYNDVAQWANLARDVADMREAATKEDKLKIYSEGKHANYTDIDGTPQTRSLASLSLDTFEEMKNDPIYNFFRHGFLVIGTKVEGESEGLFDEHSVNEYANTVVTDLLSIGKLKAAPEAAVVMNVWMYCVHQIYEVSRACKRNDANSKTDMKNALDIAAALWIGVDQGSGDDESGNMLYNIAEKAGGRFGRDSGETRVNIEVISGFDAYKLAIDIDDCGGNSNAYVEFRTLARKLIGYMTIPLMQTLIHHIMEPASTENSDYIELYTLSMGARVEACVPTAYADMLDKFVKNNFNEAEQGESIELLQSIYSCLEMDCLQVGTYRSGVVPACEDDVNPATLKFAGYPLTFDARPASKIDRDIEQIRILAKARAYEAALDYYEHGSNAIAANGDTALTLKELATSGGRTNVKTQFGLFSGYFSGNDDYADTMVRDALNIQEDFLGASTPQAAELVSGILTNIVMYMAVLEKISVAISTCNEEAGSASTNASVLLMDEAVGFYVGSIEGQEEGGRAGGNLLYARAKEMCGEFDACALDGNAGSNIDIMQAFATASDQLTIGGCDSAEATLDGIIAPALLVPLIQGTLSYAVINADLPSDSKNGTLGTGYTFSRAILPLVDAAAPGSGPIIAANMDFILMDKPVPDGAAAVFAAIRTGIQDMTTPEVSQQCANIGIKAAGSYGDVCDGVIIAPDPPTPPPTEQPATPGTPPSAPTDQTSPSPTPSPVAAQPTDPTVLGFGRYNFVTDVATVAALALDVRDMKQAQSVSVANTTYVNGGNAFVAGSDRVVSLAALSRTAADDMNEDPIFNIFRWALLSEEVFESIDTDDFNPMESAYADIVVDKALNVAQDKELAAESAVVLSVWMEICHNIFNAIDYCSDSNDKAVLSIDRAVALWIGAEQTGSAFDAGFMMYDIAQQGAKTFGLASGEALANTKIINSFVDAQQVAGRCVNDSKNFLELKIVVSQIMKQMTIPLLQNLLYYIDQQNENYIELYALAVIPQAIGCGASDFIGLRDLLLSEKSFNHNDIDETFNTEMRRFQKCLRISCSDLMGNTNPSSTLRDLIEGVCVEDSAANGNLAGFETTTDVSEISRLDLDVLQIGILMETKAYGAAEDLYWNGYNSHGNLKPMSLRDIAKSTGRSVVPQYSTFSTYFGSDNYSDDLVQRAIRRTDMFENASRDQAAEAVTRALQGVVSYMAVQEKLYSSVQECKQSGSSVALKTFEEGVALFVGSLEGSERGGNGAWDGTFLFALGKETCDAFGTCEASDNADVNEDILEVMDDARDLLQSDDCDGALAVIENEVLGDLPVAMLQAFLFYTVETAAMNAGNTTYPLASGYVFSRAILPLVKSVNATSATAIEAEIMFDLTKKPVPGGPDTVYDAITFTLPGMNVDCDDIGTFQSRDVCAATADVVRPNIDTSTNLGEGLYTTTTYVDDRAAIAKDLVTIKEALESGSLDLARVIYKIGDNSNVYNDNGIKVGQRSLQKFSTETTLDMTNEPLFNIYRYAIRDANGQYMGKDARLYADSIVEQLLSTTFPNAAEKTLPAEAMLVLNLWMLLAHELFDTLNNCRNKVIADTDGIHSIDEAVAYWIGDGQQAGNGDTGHLFYALAERMGDKFQQDVNGQSRTNINILRLFNQAKLELSFPNACTDNPNTYPRLRQIVYRILSQMTIPLVQSLIHNLRENDQLRVKLYAQTFVPLTAACDPELSSYLQLKLMDGAFNVIETEEIVERIRTSFDCLGISCDDVGMHVSETDNICIDTPKMHPLAGYVPNVDVRDYAQLDLDILEAGLLMEMGAYTAVDDLYTYGKHALVDGISGPEMLTLAQMATTSDRSVVPEFDSFVRYFENNKYADTIIRTALDNNKMPNASAEQRKEIVVKSMQYLVIYMAALQAMHDAIAGCDSTDASRVVGAQAAWDRAAALLIGSIEGEKTAGTNNGQSFYALAKKRCAQFGTCGDSGTSVVNEEVVSLFYTGRGELEGGSCGALRRAVESIEPLLLVPLIQSTIRYAIENTRLDKAPVDGDFAEGYIFSRAVLPLIEDVNRDAADAINRNMNFQFTIEPVAEGSLVVINSFAKVYSGMDVDCEKVGKVSGVDTCTGANQSTSNGKLSGGAIFGIIFTIAIVIGLLSWLFIRGRKERKKKQGAELAPMFRRSNGVMNHQSDILGGKHNDAAIIDGDEAFVHRMQHQADALSMA